MAKKKVAPAKKDAAPADDKKDAAAEKAPTKKSQRAALQESVKDAINAAGPAGATADTIARSIGLIDEGTSDEDVKGALHEVRAVARQVVKKEGWSRMNRDGRNVLYQPISEDEAQVQKDAADAEKKAAAEKKKAEKKAEKKAAAAEDDDDDADGAGDDADDDWEGDDDDDDDDGDADDADDADDDGDDGDADDDDE